MHITKRQRLTTIKDVLRAIRECNETYLLINIGVIEAKVRLSRKVARDLYEHFDREATASDLLLGSEFIATKYRDESTSYVMINT